MAKPPNLNHLELLYEALRSDRGVVIETDDAEFLRQKLYALRKEDPEFATLSFVISPINGVDLWIVKTKGNSNAEEVG